MKQCKQCMISSPLDALAPLFRYVFHETTLPARRLSDTIRRSRNVLPFALPPEPSGGAALLHAALPGDDLAGLLARTRFDRSRVLHPILLALEVLFAADAQELLEQRRVARVRFERRKDHVAEERREAHGG